MAISHTSISTRLLWTLMPSLFCIHCLMAQFAPPAGQVGSTAISKNDSNIKAWATQCVVQVGPTNIADSSAANASAGSASNATEQAGDGSIVSLGDGGFAILQFEKAISNGPGADFAVFENAFNATFLELAFVEVSSDGQNYVRFPAVSNTDTSLQVGGFGALDATKIYNLAGKYQANYGTPFDLEELIQDSAVLDINAVTHVKIIDVVGSIQPTYCSRDSRGVKINDPWPTPFTSGGFDLDAVAVLHQQGVAITLLEQQPIFLFPNPIPLGMDLQISNKAAINLYGGRLYNNAGQCIWRKKGVFENIETHNYPAGFYHLILTTEHGIMSYKITIQP